MASLNSYISHVTGTTGSANTIEPKAGWKAYLLPRGAHASAASVASPITFDSSAAAARFSASDWFQVGTDTSTIRQVAAVGGNSISYTGGAVTVTQNNRILRIGTSQPQITGSNAEYQPHTTTYPRDDDGGTPNGSSSVTDANGQYQFFAADALYDILIQDSNGANRGIVVDAGIGIQVVNDFVPVDPGGASLGTCTTPFNSLRFVGMLESGVTSASGRTAFKFDTCNAITAGNLFSFGNTGSVKVYGDTHGGIFHSWTLPEVFNVKSAKYGAKGDGSTDDTLAISNAITDATGAADGDGGVVFFPPGIYITSSPLVVLTRCVLMGSGERITVLRAHASNFTFNGTTTSMVQIGVPGTDAYGQVRSMDIDCNNVANSIGLFYAKAQEKAGAWNCNILRYRVAGIKTASNFACQNLSILNCDFGPSASGSVAQGISLTEVSGPVIIDNATFNPYDGATQQEGPCVSAKTSRILMRRIHIERHNTGVSFDTATVGTIQGFDLANNVPMAGYINIGTLLLDAGGTWTDQALGVTFGENSGGWALKSNDGSTQGTKSRFFSSRTARSYLGSPTTFGTTLTADGAFGVTGSAHFGGQISHDLDSVTPTTTVSVSGRNTLLITGSGAPMQITGGVTGQRVQFIGVAGAAVVFTRGNTLSLSAATVTIGPNDVINFTSLDGTSWVQSSLVDNGAFA